MRVASLAVFLPEDLHFFIEQTFALLLFADEG
jgi:hypothetical protein